MGSRLTVANYRCSHRLEKIPFWLVFFGLHKLFCLVKICEHWRPRGNQLKVISNFSQNETESKRAEFKTSPVIIITDTRTFNNLLLHVKCKRLMT